MHFSTKIRKPKMAEMVKVHVTYDETKRILSYQKGSDVQGLRYVFLQVFSDVTSDHVAPANVKFQRYDAGFADYVELDNCEKIEGDIKIRALVWKHKQVTIILKTNTFCPVVL